MSKLQNVLVRSRSASVGATDAPNNAGSASMEGLLARRQAAKAMLDQLANLQTADPEAEGAEWNGVVTACEDVRKMLRKTELEAPELAVAKQLFEKIAPAQTSARQAIQVRLGNEAQNVRGQLAPFKKMDPDAAGNEWDGVLAACNAVESALPQGTLKKANITKAKSEFTKIADAVSKAQAVIQARLRSEAQTVRDGLKVFTTPDPEAEGNEWEAVRGAIKEVEAALPTGTLHTADIVNAKAKLVLVGQAADKARLAIQTRLQKAVQDIRDKLAVHRTPDPEAQGGEWAMVLAACQKTEDALPTGTLKAEHLVMPNKLLKRIPVVKQTAVLKIQTRLRKEAAELRAQVKSYREQAAESGPDGAPVLAACGAVDKELPNEKLTRAQLDKAKQLLKDIDAGIGPLYEALWKKDVAAAAAQVKQAQTEASALPTSVVTAFREFLKDHPTIKACQDTLKKTLEPKNNDNYREQKAALEKQANDVCALFRSLKEGLTDAKVTAESTPEAVKTALEAKNFRHQAESGYQQLVKRGTAEIEACEAAKVKADQKYSFRSLVEDAEKQLSSASASLGSLAEDLKKDMQKDWPKMGFLDSLKNKDFNQQALDTARQQMKFKSDKLDKVAKQREKEEKRILDAIALYGDSTATTSLEQLEAVIAAVKRNLLGTKAKAIRNKLSQGNKAIAVSVWTKALDEALQAQLATKVPCTAWAARFGMGQDQGASWGIDDTGEVVGKQTHITLYPAKDGVDYLGTNQQIVDKVLAGDPANYGVHITRELHGKMNPGQNQSVYYQGKPPKNLYPQHADTITTPMRTLLTDYINSLPAIVQEWKDRGGLTTEQIAANKSYIEELEKEIDNLT